PDGAGGLARLQSRVRRDARRADHRDHHRARHLPPSVSVYVNAREFHDLTTHTPSSVRSSGHALDWDIKPFPFKVYTDAPAVELPRTFDPIATDTLTAIATSGEGNAPLTLERLAAVLYLSAGV